MLNWRDIGLELEADEDPVCVDTGVVTSPEAEGFLFLKLNPLAFGTPDPVDAVPLKDLEKLNGLELVLGALPGGTTVVFLLLKNDIEEVDDF